MSIDHARPVAFICHSQWASTPAWAAGRSPPDCWGGDSNGKGEGKGEGEGDCDNDGDGRVRATARAMVSDSKGGSKLPCTHEHIAACQAKGCPLCTDHTKQAVIFDVLWWHPKGSSWHVKLLSWHAVMTWQEEPSLMGCHDTSSSGHLRHDRPSQCIKFRHFLSWWAIIFT